MLTLYQTEWCPFCHRVRQTLTELGLTVTMVNVPASADGRAELEAISGQRSVPALTDGDKILTGSDEIIEYLIATYPAPDDAGAHARAGAWRTTTTVSLAPRAALAHLLELLADKGLGVFAQMSGPDIDARLPKDYALLQVGVPAAAARAFDIDEAAPTAIMFPLAVVPTKDGRSRIAAAHPAGQVWLYGEPGLHRVQVAVNKRLREVIEAL